MIFSEIIGGSFMKNLIIKALIFILILYSPCGVYAEYNYNPLGVDDEEIKMLIEGDISNSIGNLAAMGIVKNSEIWENDYISRRNAFEILYVIHERGCRAIYGEETSHLKGRKIFYDVDEGTYDYYLAETMFSCGFFRGKTDCNGNRIADLDTNITYYEAMTAMSRMLGNHYKFSYQIGQSLVPGESNPYPYFTLFEEIGIINSNTRLNYSTLTVTEDMLNQYIPAREYLHMVYSMLYVPNVNNGCYGGTIYGFRYIDYFVKYYEGSYAEYYDDKDNIIP